MTGTPITQLDLRGFEQVDQLAWRDANGTVLTLHYFDLRPDLPAPLHEPQALAAALTRHVAGAGAGMIEVGVLPVDGVPAVRQVLKLKHPQGHGQVFVGTYTVPRATCSTVLKLQAAETGTTGVREALIMAQLGPDRYFAPSPYAPDATGGLPFHWGDHPQYDAQFPQHPLTLVRQGLHRLLPSVRLDERFKAVPAFQ